MEGLKCLHHISEPFSDKIINNCPDYFDYDNTGDVDGSIFIFCARLIASREGAFFYKQQQQQNLAPQPWIPLRIAYV